jgi:hypothetical protein
LIYQREDVKVIARFQEALAIFEELSAGFYQRALELARQLGDRLSVSKWLRDLADAYLLLGSPAFARKFQVEADLVSKALTEERKRAAHVAASLMNHVSDASSLHLSGRAS